MKDWVKGLLAAIIAGVAIYWLTVGWKSPDQPTRSSNPTTTTVDHPTEAPSLVPSMARLEDNTNRNDSDYSWFESDSADSCATACLRENRCKAMTFNTQTRMCYLKEDTPPPSNYHGQISSVKEYK